MRKREKYVQGVLCVNLCGFFLFMMLLFFIPSWFFILYHRLRPSISSSIYMIYVFTFLDFCPKPCFAARWLRPSRRRGWSRTWSRTPTAGRSKSCRRAKKRKKITIFYPCFSVFLKCKIHLPMAKSWFSSRMNRTSLRRNWRLRRRRKRNRIDPNRNSRRMPKWWKCKAGRTLRVTPLRIRRRREEPGLRQPGSCTRIWPPSRWLSIANPIRCKPNHTLHS